MKSCTHPSPSNPAGSAQPAPGRTFLPPQTSKPAGATAIMKLCPQQKMNCRLFSDRAALAIEKPPRRAKLLRGGFLSCCSSVFVIPYPEPSSLQVPFSLRLHGLPPTCPHKEENQRGKHNDFPVLCPIDHTMGERNCQKDEPRQRDDAAHIPIPERAAAGPIVEHKHRKSDHKRLLMCDKEVIEVYSACNSSYSVCDRKIFWYRP